MLSHLFKLMWNKKKQNSLLLVEILISFLATFAVFVMLVDNYINYRKDMGFNHDNLLLVTYNNTYKTQNTDSLNMYYDILQKTIRSMPEVEDISFCSGNAPFKGSTWMSSVGHEKDTIRNVNVYTGSPSHLNTLKLNLREGRWFNKGDATAAYRPAVLDETLKEKLFGNKRALGKIVSKGGDRHYRVVGIIQTVKAKGDYEAMGPGFYESTDTASFRWLERMFVKVHPGTGAAFEAKLYKTLANYMKDSNVEIEQMEVMRKDINMQRVIPMIIAAVVGGFLVINVALGIFGVLWYNINKRRGELGLRRAIGASGMSVAMQVVLESMVLATFALLLGVFFAAQFPLLNIFDKSTEVYVISILLSTLFVYLLVFICSVYPGGQAAKIYPAVALHED